MNASKKKEVTQVLEMSEKMLKKTKKPSKQQEKPPKKVLISVDLDKAKFSEIVQLKKIFQAYPGTDTVTVNFLRNSTLCSQIDVDPLEGVDFSKKLKESVLSIPMVQKLSTE